MALCGVLAVGFAAPVLVQEVRRSTLVEPATQPEDFEVVVDTTNGTITLPWDRYFLSESEQAEVSRASALAMRACAAEHGYDIPEQSTGGDIPYDRRYGIWWMPQVEVFGYNVPSTPAMSAWQAAGGDQVSTTDQQMAILEDCNATPDVQQFWPKTQLSISGRSRTSSSRSSRARPVERLRRLGGVPDRSRAAAPPAAGPLGGDGRKAQLRRHTS